MEASCTSWHRIYHCAYAKHDSHHSIVDKVSTIFGGIWNAALTGGHRLEDKLTCLEEGYTINSSVIFLGMKYDPNTYSQLHTYLHAMLSRAQLHSCWLLLQIKRSYDASTMILRRGGMMILSFSMSGSRNGHVSMAH